MLGTTFFHNAPLVYRTISYNTRSSGPTTLTIPCSRTDVYKHSFFPETIARLEQSARSNPGVGVIAPVQESGSAALYCITNYTTGLYCIYVTHNNYYISCVIISCNLIRMGAQNYTSILVSAITLLME